MNSGHAGQLVTISVQIPTDTLERTTYSRGPAGKFRTMWAFIVLLLLLWIVGLITSTLVGGLLHLLLVFAVALVFLNLFRLPKNL